MIERRENVKMEKAKLENALHFCFKNDLNN